MTVAADDRLTQITATGGQTALTYDFKIADEDDIEVWEYDVSEDTLTLLTITTHYTVGGVGDGGGGTVTLGSGATLNDLYALRGARPVVRASDYSPGGDFTAGAHNAEEDAQIEMLQELTRDRDRSMLLDHHDTDGSGSFDARGNNIRDVADPVLDQDASTKAYADSIGAAVVTDAAAAAASAAAASTSETNSATSETNAATSETNAAASAVAAAAAAAALQGTSTTSLAIGTGAKVFTTQASKQWTPGLPIFVVSDAAPTVDFMFGTVTSYSGTTLTLNITDIGGSGTLADWTINVSGIQGDTGATGPTGPVGVPDDSVRAATTTNGTLATAYENGDTIDGVVLATGDMILLKDQSAAEENGVYDVQASGAPVRGDDWNTWDEHVGKLVTVQEGTANADTIYLCTSDAGGTLETTALTFEQKYGSATASAEGLVELATDAEAITGTDATRAVTPESLQAKVAGAAAKGIVELATDGETQTGTDTARALTPANLTAKEASAAEVRAATANRILTTDIMHTAAVEVALTSSTNVVAWDMENGVNFKIVNLAENTELAFPTNPKVGRQGRIRIEQDGTGTRTVTIDPSVGFYSPDALVNDETADAETIYYYDVISATRIELAIRDNTAEIVV